MAFIDKRTSDGMTICYGSYEKIPQDFQSIWAYMEHRKIVHNSEKILAMHLCLLSSFGY